MTKQWACFDWAYRGELTDRRYDEFIYLGEHDDILNGNYKDVTVLVDASKVFIYQFKEEKQPTIWLHESLLG